jgi:hypothetical protein
MVTVGKIYTICLFLESNAMQRPNRRQMLGTVGSGLTAILAGCLQGGGGGGEETDTPTDDEGMEATDTPQETDTPEETDTPDEMAATGNVRVAHFSPDAPNVDVYVDDEQALSDVPFRAVSDYLEVPTGTRTVQITAAGDPDTVAFEGDIDLAPDTDYTVAAIGELAAETTDFRPLVLEDDNADPGEGTARIRAVHASPDAPAVDITVAANGDAVFDGVAFSESGYAEVPAGDYTLQIRGDTDSNDGDVVAEFDVSLSGSTVYTAFAGGYLTPDDSATEKPFDLTIVQDAVYSQ